MSFVFMLYNISDMFSLKNNRKILVALLIFISATFFSNVAEASSLSSDVSKLFNFINKNVIGQIKKDFCRQYILGLSSGEWKQGEFRSDLGKRFCTSYKVPDTTNIISQTNIEQLNGNFSVSTTETPSTSSINNPIPDVYVPNTGVDKKDLSISQVISLTNSERKNNDSTLVNLKENTVLKNIAAIRTKDMFKYQYFEHNSPSGDNASKEAVANGYLFVTIGENIALGNFDGSKGLVDAWMNSTGHRANILNKNYTEIGVYAEQGIYKGQDVWIATQIFGKSLSGCSQPETTLKNKISNYKITADSMLVNIDKIDAELKIISTGDVQIYNSKVAERNTLASLYNNLAKEIKTLVTEYNNQVSKFNLCIKTI